MTEPQDVVVSSELPLMTSGDLSGNLVLPCTVSGTPPPTITWYRDDMPIDSSFVSSTGSLVLNVTEGGVEASRTGVIYYCLASNMIGQGGYTASLRSRDVNVTYTCKYGMINQDLSSDSSYTALASFQFLTAL